MQPTGTATWARMHPGQRGAKLHKRVWQNMKKMLDPGTGSSLHTILGMCEPIVGNAICDPGSLRN